MRRLGIVLLSASIVVAGCRQTPEKKTEETFSPTSVSKIESKPRPLTPPKLVKKNATSIEGKWILVSSSEDPSTASGIPDYIVWQGNEWTSDGHELSSYRHKKSSEVYTSDVKYDLKGNRLIRIASALTTTWVVKVSGDKLEIRDGSVFEKYERVSSFPE